MKFFFLAPEQSAAKNQPPPAGISKQIARLTSQPYDASPYEQNTIRRKKQHLLNQKFLHARS